MQPIYLEASCAVFHFILYALHQALHQALPQPLRRVFIACCRAATHKSSFGISWQRRSLSRRSRSLRQRRSYRTLCPSGITNTPPNQWVLGQEENPNRSLAPLHLYHHHFSIFADAVTEVGRGKAPGPSALLLGRLWAFELMQWCFRVVIVLKA